MTESLFFLFFLSLDAMKGNTVVYQNFCPLIGFNGEARDKTSGSKSGELTFGILKQLRNLIKSGLNTSGSSNCDILGGQEKGSFSFTFLTNLLAQPFIGVSSEIPMQKTAASTYGHYC